MQKGSNAKDKEVGSGMSFVQGQKEFDMTLSFMDTAGVIANCDYIVTSDSCIAHIAGAMGKETYIGLKMVPEWRWGLNKKDSIWYKDCMLIRQRERGNWKDVIKQIVFLLEKKNA